MRVIGLTGAIQSGKSTVLSMLGKRGARIDDADTWVRALMLPGKPAYRKLVKAFGREILDKRRRIRRSALRTLAAQCPQALSTMETILHPELYRQIERQKRKLKARKGLWVIEIPLLFETGFDRLMDRTVCVCVGPALHRRLNRARGMNEELFKKLVKRQWTEAKKAARADYVISNRSSKPALQREVKRFYELMISR